MCVRQVLSKMDTAKFADDLSNFRSLILSKWGTFYDAFVNMSSIKVSDAKARLSKQARQTKAEGTRFVCFEQFRLVAKDLKYTPEHDLRLIFRYIDFNMEGTLVLEDFMCLPVVTVGDTRECFSKVKAYFLEQWGSFPGSYSGLSRAVQAMHEEEKRAREKELNPELEDEEPGDQEPDKVPAGKASKAQAKKK